MNSAPFDAPHIIVREGASPGVFVLGGRVCGVGGAGAGDRDEAAGSPAAGRTGTRQEACGEKERRGRRVERAASRNRPSNDKQPVGAGEPGPSRARAQPEKNRKSGGEVGRVARKAFDVSPTIRTGIWKIVAILFRREASPLPLRKR
jgi:hypothetical protein